jgi:DNA polymerase IV
MGDGEVQTCHDLNLPASDGVAPNKFLAKLASDRRKPDGLFVVQPDEVDSFLLPVAVSRLPGEKLDELSIATVADLRRVDLAKLEHDFGRFGIRLYELARGIDESEVVPDRPTKSMSVPPEPTFAGLGGHWGLIGSPNNKVQP